MTEEMPERTQTAGIRLSAESVNSALKAYGESVRTFFRSQKRSAMVSPLFNLPGRLILGSYCYYENLPRLLRLLTSWASPEELGRRMRGICVRPNYVNVNSLALGYLNAREQIRLLGGDIYSDTDDLTLVMDFWDRVNRSYRQDGRWLPDQSNFSAPVLSEAEARGWNDRLRSDWTAKERQQARRMMATLELFTFILNGEARVGICHHGPYPLGGGESLLVKEFVGLREDYFSWARTQMRVPFSSLARVVRLRDVKCEIVLMGSLTTEPADFQKLIVAEEIFVPENGSFRPLTPGEFRQVAAAAADAQLELYRRAMEWDERFRVAYGAELYGSLLKPFGDLVGRGEEFATQIRSSFAESTERHVDRLVSGEEKPLVLQHIAQTKGPVYAPLAVA